MLRGTLIFICDNCGHKFKALDIEYNCTTLSAPQNVRNVVAIIRCRWRLMMI